jgi:hypothetical protein
LWGDPSLVDALKTRAIQRIRGSQYLHRRASTAEKNIAEPAKATGKIVKYLS